MPWGVRQGHVAGLGVWTEWDMDTPQLVHFMSKNVAAKIDLLVFWAGLVRLRTEWGMDTPQLVHFMSKSVAAKIDSPRQ